MTTTISKTEAPGLNRHERRKAAKAQRTYARNPGRQKAYRQLYYQFRGKWLTALKQLDGDGLIESRLGEDGKRMFCANEYVTDEFLDLPEIPKHHREKFLTDPGFFAWLCDHLDYKPTKGLHP